MPTTPQSTQYDQIGSLYDGMKLLPAPQLERINMQSTLAPYIQDARVLDLACGTGYFSRLLLEWGARQVVGVDISPRMVDGARRRFSTDPALQHLESKTCFLVGNAAAEPLRLGPEQQDEPFDIVLGVWLLNYAPNGAVMSSMFRNVSRHLRPGGGVFVGITLHPSSDPCAVVPEKPRSRAASKYGVEKSMAARVEDGCRIHVIGYARGQGDVEFDAYYLRKAVYEESAREGGMVGKVQWRAVRLPDREEMRTMMLGEEVKDEGEGYWHEYSTGAPHFGILVVER